MPIPPINESTPTQLMRMHTSKHTCTHTRTRVHVCMPVRPHVLRACAHATQAAHMPANAPAHSLNTRMRMVMVCSMLPQTAARTGMQTHSICMRAHLAVERSYDTDDHAHVHTHPI